MDRDGILWLTGEHYVRRKPITYHAARLPRGVMWYCDPAGAQERCDLIRLGLKVRKGNNSLESGIAAVTARLADGTLKVLDRACPNLLREAALYRWDNDADGSETPLSETNHALDALRYLVTRLDQYRPADREVANLPSDDEASQEADLQPPPRPLSRPYQDLRDDPAVWTIL